MVVPFSYSYVSWSPPKLSEQEELELGRQIAIQGRDHWANEFRKSMSKSLKEHAKTTPSESMDYTRNWNPHIRRIFRIGLAIMVITGLRLMNQKEWGNLERKLLSVVVPATIIFTVILVLSYRRATSRFENWVDYLVSKYASHVAKGGLPLDYRN